MSEDAWSFCSFPSRTYDEREYLSAHERLYKVLFDDVAVSDIRSICDLGCGTGIGYSLLDNRDRYSISGIDYVPEFIDVFNSRGFQGFVGDIGQRLPFGDDSFDCVIANSVLEHTLKPRELAEEIQRILKPGGLLLLATPNALSLKLRWAHVRGRNPFHPLIDNLWRHAYMKRCAVFYSAREIAGYFTSFSTERISGSYTGAGFLPHLWNSVLPRSFRDVIVVVLRNMK
jgi:SAM-dependent methyltransferase